MGKRSHPLSIITPCLPPYMSTELVHAFSRVKYAYSLIKSYSYSFPAGQKLKNQKKRINLFLLISPKKKKKTVFIHFNLNFKLISSCDAVCAIKCNCNKKKTQSYAFLSTFFLNLRFPFCNYNKMAAAITFDVRVMTLKFFEFVYAHFI